jgi:hypothetical protein
MQRSARPETPGASSPRAGYDPNTCSFGGGPRRIPLPHEGRKTRHTGLGGANLTLYRRDLHKPLSTHLITSAVFSVRGNLLIAAPALTYVVQ